MLKKSTLTFPVVFELLIWLFYVCIYKYSYYIDHSGLPHIPNNDFPYPEICLYAICSTLYLVPYYKWAVPRLLYLKKYLWVLVLSLIYFVFLTTLNHMAVSWIFAEFTTGMPSHRFFTTGYIGFFMDWNMILTDAIAFLCVAFSRFSYQNEVQRHRIETDHLHLQLNLLKTQLQPHFLFNTLNSLYGMSLTGSKETPRFILLLSQMMQYILYDCDQEEVALQDEMVFLEGYFELEQKKFPQANIVLKVAEDIPPLKIPPLLFLPLVENSFKHGKHKLENEAGVLAELSFKEGTLVFRIENETLPANPLQTQAKRGGIGLNNIKKRLELYYPGRHQLLLTTEGPIFVAELSIKP
ncbi:histidine kinase [Pedobacter sp. ASV28]|uniref:sensor histidine kinase n=1 Tax=Pedobacter sp. ASV28 TaxID=2795123 RepID=UPI0018EA5518